MLARMTRTTWLAVLLATALLAGCSRETGSTVTASSASSPSAAASTSSAAMATGSGGPSASPAPAAAPADDEQQVRAAFSQYKEAIGQGKGEEAARVVSEKTLATFERLRIAALHLAAAEVKRSPVMDRTMILVTRARVRREDLERWRGRELFVHAVDQGWVGKDAQRLEPDAVTIDGSTASLGLRAGSEVVVPAEGFRLYREQGGWKLDVMSIARPESASMKAVQKELQQIDPDPNRALEKVVASLLGKPVGPEIWEPLVPKR
jgi:hypothetical protein